MPFKTNNVFNSTMLASFLPVILNKQKITEKNTDRPRRSALRCSAIFYIRHDFDGNGSAQCIFASMFCHFDVRLPSSDFGDERVKSMRKCPVVLSRSVTLID